MVSIKILRSLDVINFKNVKKVMKDGSIQFKNRKSAIEYMRKRCKASVNKINPFEREIGIKGTRVVGEADGTLTSCNLPFSTKIMGHSHPDTYARGCTTAPSAEDYFANLYGATKCKKMFVFNSYGEYYSLEKIPGFNYSKVDLGELDKLYISTIAENTPVEQKRLLYSMEFLKPNELHKCWVDATHKFWVKFGKYFGVKAETNFSNFSNLPIK